MAITATQRQTREWPLLVLALSLVGAICIPLWQWSAGQGSGGEQWIAWTPERLGRLVTSMATVHYLAWAIPALGFLGTVRGLSGGLSMAGKVGQEIQTFIDQATRHLTIAFDCTLIALVLSLALMFLVHSVQRDEEALVMDCQQYCLEHLVNRLYELEPVQQ